MPACLLACILACLLACLLAGANVIYRANVTDGVNVCVLASVLACMLACLHACWSECHRWSEYYRRSKCYMCMHVCLLAYLLARANVIDGALDQVIKVTLLENPYS